jgi:putative oxidoreductase
VIAPDLLRLTPASATWYGQLSLRRLFSTFARGLPGAGLLLLRLVGGAGLVVRAAVLLRDAPPTESAWPHVLAAGGGVLLLAGLWTPIAGVLVAITEIWSALAHADDLWPGILLGTVGAALALLGPGAWSVDARLFGWKRIGVRDRKSSSSHT